jgi:hypothetical protein
MWTTYWTEALASSSTASPATGMLPAPHSSHLAARRSFSRSSTCGHHGARLDAVPWLGQRRETGGGRRGDEIGRRATGDEERGQAHVGEVLSPRISTGEEEKAPVDMPICCPQCASHSDPTIAANNAGGGGGCAHGKEGLLAGDLTGTTCTFTRSSPPAASRGPVSCSTRCRPTGATPSPSTVCSPVTAGR